VKKSLPIRSKDAKLVIGVVLSFGDDLQKYSEREEEEEKEIISVKYGRER
jgi:hypothetical protein